jgi:hypothetical protein
MVELQITVVGHQQLLRIRTVAWIIAFECFIVDPNGSKFDDIHNSVVLLTVVGNC